MFSASFVASKLSLPTTACTMPALSLRNSTLPALYSATVLPISGVTVPARGDGIRPARTEHFTQRADELHHVRRRDAGVEVGPAAFDLVGQVFFADEIGAGRLGFFGLRTLGEHDDALLLADAVRQHDRAADHLFGLGVVDAQADRDFDRLIELRAVETLEGFDGFGNGHRIFFTLGQRVPDIVWIALPWHVDVAVSQSADRSVR